MKGETALDVAKRLEAHIQTMPKGDTSMEVRAMVGVIASEIIKTRAEIERLTELVRLTRRDLGLEP